MRMTPHRLVFVDETSTNTKMTRLRGRALCGEGLRALAPFGRWGTQTFIAGLRLCGLTAPWVLDGPMTRAAFSWRLPSIRGTLSSSTISAAIKVKQPPNVQRQEAPGSCSCPPSTWPRSLRNPHCVMSLSNSLAETDRKTSRLCNACKGKLNWSYQR